MRITSSDLTNQHIIHFWRGRDTMHTQNIYKHVPTAAHCIQYHWHTLGWCMARPNEAIDGFRYMKINFFVTYYCLYVCNLRNNSLYVPSSLICLDMETLSAILKLVFFNVKFLQSRYFFLDSVYLILLHEYKRNNWKWSQSSTSRLSSHIQFSETKMKSIVSPFLIWQIVIINNK